MKNMVWREMKENNEEKLLKQAFRRWSADEDNFNWSKQEFVQSLSVTQAIQVAKELYAESGKKDLVVDALLEALGCLLEPRCRIPRTDDFIMDADGMLNMVFSRLPMTTKNVFFEG